MFLLKFLESFLNFPESFSFLSWLFPKSFFQETSLSFQKVSRISFSFWKFPRNSQKFLRNFQNFPGNFREISGNFWKHVWNFLEMFWKFPESFFFKEISEKFPGNVGNFPEVSQKFPRNFWERSGFFPENFGKVSGKKHPRSQVNRNSFL